MKQMKRNPNLYQNATKTNVLNLDNLTAISYNWWTYLKVIDGKLTFNAYRYSQTTSKHQRQTLNVLKSMGITVENVVNQRESL
jgi:hypothetical protein